MISYSSAKTKKDLLGILRLQQANLAINLTPEEIKQQGFVTVVHALSDLQKLNDIEQHIIAKYDSKVIAYLLAMTAASKNDIPVLRPMFELFDGINLNGKTVAGYNYIVVGQVCVDKSYRGQGILDDCYLAYKTSFQPNYDFAITEIATKNLRSLKAHYRIGFKEIHTYKAPDGEGWTIVVWLW